MSTDNNIGTLESAWASEVENISAAWERLERLGLRLGTAYIESGRYGLESEGFVDGVTSSDDPVSHLDELDEFARATLAGRAFALGSDVGGTR